MSWVHRYEAINFSVVSFVTVASHTCVVRPVWRGFAVAITRSPSRALETKFAEQSTVVKLLAPWGQWWLTPKAQSASANVITTGAHKKPVPAMSSWRTVSRAIGSRRVSASGMVIPSRFKKLKTS